MIKQISLIALAVGIAAACATSIYKQFSPICEVEVEV
jgi:hypothetical protein